MGDQLIRADEAIDGVEIIFNAADRAQITLSFFEATWAMQHGSSYEKCGVGYLGGRFRGRLDAQMCVIQNAAQSAYPRPYSS